MGVGGWSGWDHWYVLGQWSMYRLIHDVRMRYRPMQQEVHIHSVVMTLLREPVVRTRNCQRSQGPGRTGRQRANLRTASRPGNPSDAITLQVAAYASRNGE